MKFLIRATLTLLAVSFVASSAEAKTTTGTIGESAQIVPGSSVSAYLVGGQIVTGVTNDAAHTVNPYGMPPVIRISFEMKPSWYLVKRVTWDKAHRQLTIDF